MQQITIEEALTLARQRDASDLHVIGDAPVKIRTKRKMEPLQCFVSREAVDLFIASVINDKLQGIFDRTGCFDVAYVGPTGNIRINVARDDGGTRLAIRLLARDAYRLESLNLPIKLADFVSRNNGLIIVCGPTGSGKTTTIASMVDRILGAQTRNVHTIEDPIEFRYQSDSVVISQREIGVHTRTYSEGVRAIMRADPNVIVCGEVRDKASAAAVLDASETGHLVITTMHTGDATQTVDRLIGWFPEEAAQTRMLLSQTLIGIAAMRLVPGIREPIWPAVEILAMNDAVRTIIRSENRSGLRNVMQSSRNDGMQTLEGALNDLISAKRISPMDARALASRPEEIRG